MELKDLLTKTVAEVATEIGKLSVDEAKALEQELVVESDKVTKELTEKEFKTPTKGYADAAESIRLLLDKQTVQWQYTLGLINLYEFFNPEKRTAKMSYAMLDYTLQTLGRMSFTGYKEWKAVVTVNNYFEPLQKEYADIQSSIYAYATVHNEIMKKLGIDTPEGANPEA